MILFFLSMLTAPFGLTLPPAPILHYSSPEISVSEQESLCDEEIEIHVKGLRPRQQARIEAEAEDDGKTVWKSHALFEADTHGCIRVSEHAPLSGSYTGIDSMGLFWSMKAAGPSSFTIKSDSFTVTLRLVIDGTKRAETSLIRYRKPPDIRRIEVRENGLAGTLFLPYAEESLPAIVTLNGSSGGLDENQATLFACNGFAVFGVDEVPSNLNLIPLEYFEKALHWLKKHPAVDEDKIGLYGISAGGELALILGTLFPASIKAIAAAIPSSKDNTTAIWTFQGKPFQAFTPLPQPETSSEEGRDFEHPLNMTANFLKGLQDEQICAAATIPVEKICCPLLVISGGDDQIWPSAFFARQIEERLRAKGVKNRYVHLHYPKAGHHISIPYLPSDPVYFHKGIKKWFNRGGTSKDNEEASRDSWKKIVSFFQKELL